MVDRREIIYTNTSIMNNSAVKQYILIFLGRAAMLWAFVRRWWIYCILPTLLTLGIIWALRICNTYVSKSASFVVSLILFLVVTTPFGMYWCKTCVRDDLVAIRLCSPSGRKVTKAASKWEVLVHIADVSDILDEQFTSKTTVPNRTNGNVHLLREAAELRGQSWYNLPLGKSCGVLVLLVLRPY